MAVASLLLPPVLLLALCDVAGAGGQRWLTSVFRGDYADTTSPPSPLVNTVFDVSARRLVQAHGQHGLTAFLDLGATEGSAGLKIWNLECDQHFPPASCGPTPWHPEPATQGCGLTLSGLLPGWENALHSAVAEIGPALRNKSVTGVFLGDELCGTANIPANNLSAVATAAKSLMRPFGGGLVYVNEAVRAVNTSSWGPRNGRAPSPCFMTKIADSIDLISLDWYAIAPADQRPAGATGNITAEPVLMRQIYEHMLRPKMAPHQRVLVVPGAFADGDLRRSGPLAVQDARIAAKLKGYWQWMQEDPLVVGLNAYRWLNEGRRTASGSWIPTADALMGEGLNSLPLSRAVLAQITAQAL
jgi:hypothetical protein